MTDQTFTDDHYNTLYADQASELYQTIRAGSYGEEWGQAGWSHSSEVDKIIDWLPLSPSTHLLDYGCGAGGASLRAAALTGCSVHGIDISVQGIANAQLSAEKRNIPNTQFDVVDVADESTLRTNHYDVVICLDAITDMPNRPKILADWMQVLKPGGTAFYIDCLVLAGKISSEELAVRSGTGYNVYTPIGVNEQLILAAGFELMRMDDLTDGLVACAGDWVNEREKFSAELIKIEGRTRFDQDQTFHRLAVKLARERRLLRTAFTLQKPL